MAELGKSERNEILDWNMLLPHVKQLPVSASFIRNI